MDSILLLEVFLQIIENKDISLILSDCVGNAEYKETKYTHHEVNHCWSFEFSFVKQDIEEDAKELLERVDEEGSG